MLPYATNEIVGYTDVQPTGETCEDVNGMAAGWHEPDSNPDGSTQAQPRYLSELQGQGARSFGPRRKAPCALRMTIIPGTGARYQPRSG